MQYLKGTMAICITYGCSITDSRLVAYYDADYAGDIDGIKSCSRFMLLLNGGALLGRGESSHAWPKALVNLNTLPVILLARRSPGSAFFLLTLELLIFSHHPAKRQLIRHQACQEPGVLEEIQAF